MVRLRDDLGMLSSSGYFRRVPCPFLGRCHRVYCHFEHAGRLPTSEDASANILGNYQDRPVSATTACAVLELEKVTKTIELIRAEEEKQRHKFLMLHSCDCGNCSLIPPINSEANSFSCTGKTSIKYRPFSLYECNYTVYNPQSIYNCSACKCTVNVSGEEDASQDLAQSNSNDKTACSLWSQSLVEYCKPSTDLEYDPLVNFSSSVRKSCNKEVMEEKLECKGAIEPGSEMKLSLVSETLRNSQPFEAEMSSEDELVIDVPLTTCSKNHGEVQRKGSDDPALICKVKQCNVDEPVGVVLALDQVVNHCSNVELENNCRESEPEVQKCGKAKERSSIHLNVSGLSNCIMQQSESGIPRKTGHVASTNGKSDGLETTNTTCTSKLGENLIIGQASMKTQSHVGYLGNESLNGSLQSASDNSEESFLGEKLNPTDMEVLEFSDSDPMEECLRIFNESSKQEIKANTTVTEESSVKDIQLSVNAASAPTKQKKRIAHIAKFKGRSSFNRVIIPRIPPASKLKCHSRIKVIQQQAVQIMANVKGGQAYKTTVSDCLAQKKLLVQSSKLQYGSNVETVFRDSFRKVPGASCSSGGNVPLMGKTLDGASKAERDTLLGLAAPVPVTQRTNAKRGPKVSKNIRKRYLGFFIEEFLKTSSSRQEAVSKAVSEEKTIFDHSTGRFMYLNVAVHTLKMLRNVPNHESVLSYGQHSVKRNRPSLGTILEGAALYRALKDYVLSEEELKNGYPHFNPDKPGTAVLFNDEAKKCLADSFIQVCCHCGISFSVTPDGKYISKEECVYHWGKLIRRQVSNGWECRYSCCETVLESVGCQVAKLHVYNQKENLDGFVKTYLKLLPLDGNPGIYAVNSEVCYTKQGAELARVSVINANLEVVYDEFVKPKNEVIDYNTRLSGVSQEDLMNAKTTLGDVQRTLLQILSADTILIGYSLGKDLLALKLIHSVVIDIMFIFPHHLSLLQKPPLKNSMTECLQHFVTSITQGSGSIEKGRAYMELVLCKVKEDAKSRKQ